VFRGDGRCDGIVARDATTMRSFHDVLLWLGCCHPVLCVWLSAWGVGHRKQKC
jgi:hypothetical protein